MWIVGLLAEDTLVIMESPVPDARAYIVRPRTLTSVLPRLDLLVGPLQDVTDLQQGQLYKYPVWCLR